MDYDYILSCDLETTGLNPSYNDWITGSFGLQEADSLKIVRELELESRPSFWDQAAYLHHQIPKAKAMAFPPRIEAIQKLIEFLPAPRSFLFLCHANTNSFGNFVHFDFAFIKMDIYDLLGMFEFRKHFNDQDVLSTWTMATLLIKEKYLPKDLDPTLDALCAYYKIPLTHHQARSDRIACAALYERLRRDYYVVERIIRERDPDFNPRATALPRPIGSPDQQRFDV